jgi:hypothetical protein
MITKSASGTISSERMMSVSNQVFLVADAGAPLAVFAALRELQAYLRHRLDTFINWLAAKTECAVFLAYRNHQDNQRRERFQIHRGPLISTAIARAATNRVSRALKIASKSVIAEPLLTDFACLNVHVHCSTRFGVVKARQS